MYQNCHFFTDYCCRWSKDTPLPTPTHRYNEWADDRKSLGITPRQKGGVADEEGGDEFRNPQDKEQWEEEQKVRSQNVGVVMVTFCGCTSISRK